MNKCGKLFLLPNLLGEIHVEKVIPDGVKEAVHHIKHFIVEDEKNARRYLKQLTLKHTLQELILYPLNKHSDNALIASYFEEVFKGEDIAVLSEAGCPGIADPGAEAVKYAHQKNIEVIPLVGPSSILLALISSGMNGQSFTFNGYLPIDKTERIKKIKLIEQEVLNHNRTQIFMETPFRNMHLYEDVLKTCNASLKLCVAVDITLPSQEIKTKSIGQWKGTQIQLHKRPVIFVLGR